MSFFFMIKGRCSPSPKYLGPSKNVYFTYLFYYALFYSLFNHLYSILTSKQIKTFYFDKSYNMQAVFLFCYYILLISKQNYISLSSYRWKTKKNSMIRIFMIIVANTNRWITSIWNSGVQKYSTKIKSLFAICSPKL